MTVRPGEQLRELAAKATPGAWAYVLELRPNKETNGADRALIALAPDLAVLVADLADALAWAPRPRGTAEWHKQKDALLARVRELEARTGDRTEGGTG